MGIVNPCVDEKDTSRKRRNKIIQYGRKDRLATSKARKSWIFQNNLSFQKFYAPEMQIPWIWSLLETRMTRTPHHLKKKKSAVHGLPLTQVAVGGFLFSNMFTLVGMLGLSLVVWW